MNFEKVFLRTILWLLQIQTLSLINLDGKENSALKLLNLNIVGLVCHITTLDPI